MEYGLIGERLGHSFSKVIHESLADYTYELCEVAREDFDSFMKARDFRAINVTIPYKADCIPYLDEIDSVAKTIGAVNTIVNRDGKLYGYNTDCLGLRDLIKKVMADSHEGNRVTDLWEGRKALILGSGGTAHTAAYVAKMLKAGQIAFVGRKASASLKELEEKGESCITWDEIEKKGAEADYIINTTPVGMYPNNGGCPLDLRKIRGLKGVIDVVFNPLRTNLVLEARKLGLPAEGGLYMLVSQAVHAVEYFLDTKLPDSKLDEVFRKVYKEKENLVLLGMPGSGKTTIGSNLNLGKAFVDSDWEIEQEYGGIPELFEKYGESGFRDREAAVIERIAKETGQVIACGGGVILRQENLKNLRQNGRLVFLDRPLEDIEPTSDRPLAQDKEALRKRYEERYPIYRKEADEILQVSGTAEEMIKAIEDKEALA